MRVAVLGGTGPFGRALAHRLAVAGDDVVIGSRDPERAAAIAADLNTRVGREAARGRRNAAAVGGVDLVVLAVNAGAALETVAEIRSAIEVPLLSVASELEFRGTGAGKGALPSDERASLAERIRNGLEVSVAAGLHSLAAAKLERGRPDEDALVCGNDADAKALALELAGKLVAGRAIDAGPLASARALEGMTAVIINVNRRYKAHAGIRLTGLP